MNRYSVIDGTNKCEEIAYFWLSPNLTELCAVWAGCASVGWIKLELLILVSVLICAQNSM